MEMFGYVCSPLCKARAESHGINVPVYAGQRSVREAQQWRKTGLIGGAIAAGVIGLIGLWVWYAFFGSVPHPIFSVRFEGMAYAGGAQQVGKNQVVFLHGGTLARYAIGSKTAKWTNELITKEQYEAEIDRQMKEFADMLNESIKRGSDYRPHVPLREDLEKEVHREMESSMRLYVQDQNIWVARRGKLTRYDWETGKAGEDVTLPNGYSYGGPKTDGNELLFSEENEFGQHVITHVSLVSGEARTEKIGEPVRSAVMAASKKVTPGATTGKKGTAGAGIPKAPGKDMDKPLDPQQVAKDAQNLPYAAKVALPATLSSTMHQEDVMREIKQDEADPTTASGSMDRSWRSFVGGKYGFVQWNSRMVEEHIVSHSAMKAAPARSALENNPSVGNSMQVANEILNEMQRRHGGENVTEDQSRYEVVIHRPEAKDVADWKGEVIGQPGVIEQKTVTIVTGGKMLVVLDKSNKKLWQAELTQNFEGGSGFDFEDDGETTLGEGPCVERDGALYVFDAATLTAFDLATGTVRWRVPSIGIAGVFFDGMGSMYVNSTTADLDSIKYSRQIDITKKAVNSVLKVDCKSGKVLWTVQPGGFVSHVEGKFVFCFASHQAPDLDPDSLTTLPGMLNSAMDIRRLNPKNGKVMWDHSQQRAPLYVHFKGNTIELVFRKEVQVLKFLTL
jgi:hypothetical protein